MSRTVVRYAVAQWLTAAEIYGLDKVLPAQPQVNQPSTTPQDTNHRCNAVVMLPTYQENRLSMGGPYSGDKEANYTAEIALNFWGNDVDWVCCQDAFDELIEGILKQLRAGGRTLGRPDVILQAGEWTTGIHVQQSEPVPYDGGSYMQTAVITFEVTEILSQT